MTALTRIYVRLWKTVPVVCIPYVLFFGVYAFERKSKTKTPSPLSWEALQLLGEGYSFRYPTLNVVIYPFIQLSELLQRGVNEIDKASKRQQVDSNPGSLD